jgi:phospholipid/cholesterol/gamma-HCH transport system substrate-binding protein
LGETVVSNGDDLDALFGVESKALKNGDLVTDTKSALVLEELIGQFLFNQGGE